RDHRAGAGVRRDDRRELGPLRRAVAARERRERLVAVTAPSVQPRREEGADLAARTRRLEPRADGLVLDDDKRRRQADAEALEQIGPLLLRHRVERERLVVAAS